MKNIASPAHRLVAYLIDLLLWTNLATLPFLLVFAATDIALTLHYFLLAVIFILFANFILFFIIEGWLISRFGGTPGKLLTGTAIINSGQAHISFWRAVFRNNLGYAISGLLMGAGFFWLLVDRERRSWHDMIVDTWVIIRKRSGILIGFVALAILLAFQTYLLANIYLNLVDNLPYYRSVASDISEDLKKTIPTPVQAPETYPYIEKLPDSDPFTQLSPDAFLRQLSSDFSVGLNLKSASFIWGSFNPTDTCTYNQINGLRLILSDNIAEGILTPYFQENSFVSHICNATQSGQGWQRGSLVCVQDIITNPDGQISNIVTCGDLSTPN